MNRSNSTPGWRRRRCFIARISCLAALLAGARFAYAQETPQAPMAPPPEGHDVRRMSNVPEPPAPPSLPPEEIIKRFAQKEDQYIVARAGYGYRKMIRIDEFDREGKLVGQFLSVSEAIRAPNGRVVNKVVEHPQSTLHLVPLEPEDAKELDRIPPFPLISSQLPKYELKYIGEEQIDEIPCYIFQVKPKAMDRTVAYFEGIAWVDSKYLEVVKTYGKWVNELGDVHIANMPFTTFETYRENVDGKYWFPNYQRSDANVHLKDGDFPVRLVIKWTEFKPLPAGATTAAPVATSAPGTREGAPASASGTTPAPAPPKPQR
jgi:hypothetical protein